MINPDVTPDVDAVVLKALAKNPLNRYQSAAEMRADLLRAAAGRPVMATPVLHESETVAMAAATRQIGPVTRQQMPARVGDPRANRRSPWVPAALAALGVLAVVALVAGLLLYRNNQAANINVPNVVNKNRAAAEAEIQAAGLRPEFRGTVNSADCTVNNVVAQDPQAGTKAKRNATIQYDICGGPVQITVPTNLVGSTKDAADGQLRELGLVPQFNPVNNNAPKDQVVRVPDAGKKVPKDSTVVVEISKGNVIEVPDVTGKTQSEATAVLNDRGFRVSVAKGSTVPADEAGKVTSQDPKGGETAQRNSVVTIEVSQPEPTESPTPASPTPSDTGSPTGGPGGGGGGPPSGGGGGGLPPGGDRLTGAVRW
jgi:serine/threonine-protein kinase